MTRQEFLNGYYPLADYYPGNLRSLPSLGENNPNNPYMAKPTGEFRPPLKGEWYLSGAIIEAYQARGDWKTPFHIAKVVRVKKVVITAYEEIES